jgi:hypothetical protein
MVRNREKTMETTEAIVSEAEILSYRVPALRAQLKTMNRKAGKLGKSPLTLEVGERIIRKFKRTNALGIEYDVEREYTQVTVTGERPVLSGWSLAGVKDVMGNGEMLLSEVPGVEVPARFKSPAWNCEHCNTNRRRKQLVIVRNVETGEFKQVGKTCLSDFLGGMDVKGYLAYYAMILSVESGDVDPDEPGFWSGPRGATSYDPVRFLSVTSAVVRKFGWVSVGKARESFGELCPTVNLTCQYILDRTDDAAELRREVGEPTEQDEVRAKSALEWARGHDPEQTSGYLYNLGVAARQDCIVDKTVGIMASAISAFQRAQDREAERKAKAEADAGKPPKVHVGTVGKREVFSVTVKAVRHFESDWGVRSLVRMEDESGNILVWWTGEAPEWAEEGNAATVKGTVKKHDDYKGTPQTTVSRVALVN